MPPSRAAALFAILLALAGGAAASPDLTTALERLRTPYFDHYAEGERVYARNPWDLLAFDGRLFIGAGNAANRGPAPNAGPVPLFVLGPDGRFQREGTVDDERVARFRVVDGTLFLPGDDATEGWEWGNIHRREADGRWRKLRAIPRGLHGYDVTAHQGRLYAAVSATGIPREDTAGSAVAVSEDGGERWRLSPLGGMRAFALMRDGGGLYAFDMVGGPAFRARLERLGRLEPYAPAYELVGADRFRPRRDLDRGALFPATELLDRPAYVAHGVEHGGRNLYLGVYLRPIPGEVAFGAYVADSLAEGAVRTRRVALADGESPADLLSRDGWAWLLINRPLKEGGYRISVSASRDLERWEERLHFHAATFARAFELLDGRLYVGLGGEIASPKAWRQEELHPDTGLLLRMPLPTP